MIVAQPLELLPQLRLLLRHTVARRGVPGGSDEVASSGKAVSGSEISRKGSVAQREHPAMPAPADRCVLRPCI